MKTQVKIQNYQKICDFPTQKFKNRITKIQPITLATLQRISQPAHFYSVIARPVHIKTSQSIHKYKIKINDGTSNVQTLFSLYYDSNWLHEIKQGQYYQFILHSRKSMDSEANQYYIEKINQVKDFNQITHHMVKIMMACLENKL